MQGMVVMKAETLAAHGDANLDILCRLRLHLEKSDRDREPMVHSFTLIEEEAVHNKEAEIEFHFTLPNNNVLLILPPALYRKFKIFSFMNDAIQSLIGQLNSMNEDKLRYIWQRAIARNESVIGFKIKDQLDDLIDDFMGVIQLL